jgi:hypothetical protein
MKNLKNLIPITFLALLGWMVLSSTIFQFRHPWATSTERFLYLPEAFFLEKVPYSKMRPREN